PRYYLIDFGQVRRYDPADGVLRGADKMAPEHCNLEAPTERDLFLTDIFYLENMPREHFSDVRLDFLRLLVEDMIKESPSERP
ncbi:hypothetical protein EDD18DRAFT_1054750, partial [Armillaria luteobubalina]